FVDVVIRPRVPLERPLARPSTVARVDLLAFEPDVVPQVVAVLLSRRPLHVAPDRHAPALRGLGQHPGEKDIVTVAIGSCFHGSSSVPPRLTSVRPAARPPRSTQLISLIAASTTRTAPHERQRTTVPGARTYTANSATWAAAPQVPHVPIAV